MGSRPREKGLDEKKSAGGGRGERKNRKRAAKKTGRWEESETEIEKEDDAPFSTLGSRWKTF